MKKVLVIFGTRPEAIKMAPVVKELEKNPQTKPIVCVTAQHRSMLDQVLDIFEIKPDYDLDIMESGQTLSGISSRALSGIEDVIKKEKPDIVLVHGDTTTAFAGALAAFYQQVAIGHVEAGLRTFEKYSPFPEEMNRQLIDCMADFLYAPTAQSEKNLKLKLNKGQQIFVTGNTAIDALRMTVSSDYSHSALDWANGSRLILFTAHRRENLGEPMRNMFKALKRLVNDIEDAKVIYPIHMNPLVREIANEILKDEPKIKLIEPLDVLDFHNFMERSYIIMSDSGGVQEEAPSLGKPVLVMRDTTERPEGVEAGTLRLVGTDEQTVYREAYKLFTEPDVYKRMSQASNPYGDGHASERIVEQIAKW